MIRIAKFSNGYTGSVCVSKGKKGTHNVEIWTPRHTKRYEINRKDLPEGQRTKEDIIRAAIEIYEREVVKPNSKGNA